VGEDYALTVVAHYLPEHPLHAYSFRFGLSSSEGRMPSYP
jgi:hypothetical protein